MSNDALYNIYRPKVFEDVLGQDDIINTLRNQIMNDRVSHAYMFSGIRGTGKTTVARIFARAINCEHPINGNPCNECETCKRILREDSINYREWDAASYGKIENIRDIQLEIQTRPAVGHYRVFVIDETQEMKTHAVNAFLKTLEEPPEYVVFILCTTDMRNMPPTIGSRCQHYEFKRIRNELIRQNLEEILKKEDRSISEKGISYITVRAEGSMRDALSLMDRVLSFTSEQSISYEQTLKALGVPDFSSYLKIIDYIGKGNVARSLFTLQEILSTGTSEEQINTDILFCLRNMMVALLGDSDIIIGMLPEQIENLRDEAEILGQKKIDYIFLQFSELIKILRNRKDQRTLLELTIVQTCRKNNTKLDEDLEKRIITLELHLDELMQGDWLTKES